METKLVLDPNWALETQCLSICIIRIPQHYSDKKYIPDSKHIQKASRIAGCFDKYKEYFQN